MTDLLDQQVCDVHALCRYLNMTPRRVQQLVVRGVIPKGDKRGEYELIPCIHAYHKHLKKIIARFAGAYAAHGGRSEIKERNRVERHVYRSSSPDVGSAADTLPLFDNVDVRPQQ